MRLLVIDGNSIVNRAFYGLRPLSNREGLPTHAIFGFLNILQRFLDVTDPDALCVAFDRKEPTFRHLAFEGYKAQRKGMPEELAVQIPVLKEVLDAMNIPRYELAGWEADDLIGTISRRCEEECWDCSIVTGDKDSLQLVTDHTYVSLVTTRMGQTTTREMDPAAFQAEYGFAPPQMVDFKALRGDPSDNIPGVPGVGEKTAMSLIQTYGTVEKIYENLDALDVKPGVRKKLEEGQDSAGVSYELATIQCDAPLDFSPEDNLRRPVNAALLREIFLRLEFHKLLEQMGLTGQAVFAGDAQTCKGGGCPETVTERGRMEELLEIWRREDHVSVLTLPDLSGAAVCWGENTALLFAAGLPCYEEFFREFFGPAIRKVGHNIKDLMSLLRKRGLTAEGFVFDTILAAYLLAPTDGSYELDKLGMRYFNETFPPARDYLGSRVWETEENRNLAINAMSRHSALIEDLYEILPGKLEELGMKELYETVELPLCPVLAEMEYNGFLVDRQALERFGRLLREGIAARQQEVYGLAGEEFNLNSTQQLGNILFEKLGLPAIKKTKTGYSTSAEVLEKLRGRHPIIDAVLEYRQLAKLNSTYVEGLSKVIGEDGRIHTCFQNTVTATGRLSSTEPNLQNIPVRTELGAQMRTMFIAPQGEQLVDADYSQIELRLLAHIAGDEAMRDAFREGADIHTATAAQVFGVRPEEVTHEMRRRAKAVNFGIVYGISEFSLAQDIGVTRREAGEYMERYFATFAGVRRYMHQVVEQAKREGYVSTVMGRRRWLPELTSSNYNLRSFGERVALNMPIQGTAADVMKLAMIRVYNRLRREGLKARLVLQVHDELIVECPQEETERVKRLLTEEMEGAADFSVPLRADAAAGKSWAEAKE